LVQVVHEAVVGLDELADALGLERGGHGVEIDAESGECAERGAGGFEVFVDGDRGVAAVDELIEGLRRYGIDRLWTDQGVNVQRG
jgi:hypothetical protein